MTGTLRRRHLSNLTQKTCKMSRKPPEGYRFVNAQDDLAKLSAARLLVNLCRCGHTEFEHEPFNHPRRCSKCDCLHFNWQTYIVRLPTPPPRTSAAVDVDGG